MQGFTGKRDFRGGYFCMQLLRDEILEIIADAEGERIAFTKLIDRLRDKGWRRINNAHGMAENRISNLGFTLEKESADGVTICRTYVTV